VIICCDHRLNVMWNNSFRRIFGCCWRDAVKCVMNVFCFTVKHCLCHILLIQNIILFWKKALNCDNNIIRTPAVINKWKLVCFCQNILFLQLTLLSVTSNVAYGNMCRHGTQQWKNTLLLKFVNVHFQCITFYVLICSDCVVA